MTADKCFTQQRLTRHSCLPTGSSRSTAHSSIMSAPRDCANCTCTELPRAASTSPPPGWNRATVLSLTCHCGKRDVSSAADSFSNLQALDLGNAGTHGAWLKAHWGDVIWRIIEAYHLAHTRMLVYAITELNEQQSSRHGRDAPTYGMFCRAMACSYRCSVSMPGVPRLATSRLPCRCSS